MNSRVVIFVVLVSILLDHGTTPVSGFDEDTTKKICNCANAMINSGQSNYHLEHFAGLKNSTTSIKDSDVVKEIKNKMGSYDRGIFEECLKVTQNLPEATVHTVMSLLSE